MKILHHVDVKNILKTPKVALTYFCQRQLLHFLRQSWTKYLEQCSYSSNCQIIQLISPLPPASMLWYAFSSSWACHQGFRCKNNIDTGGEGGFFFYFHYVPIYIVQDCSSLYISISHFQNQYIETSKLIHQM